MFFSYLPIGAAYWHNNVVHVIQLLLCNIMSNYCETNNKRTNWDQLPIEYRYVPRHDAFIGYFKAVAGLRENSMKMPKCSSTYNWIFDNEEIILSVGIDAVSKFEPLIICY